MKSIAGFGGKQPHQAASLAQNNASGKSPSGKSPRTTRTKISPFLFSRETNSFFSKFFFNPGIFSVLESTKQVFVGQLGIEVARLVETGLIRTRINR